MKPLYFVLAAFLLSTSAQAQSARLSGYRSDYQAFNNEVKLNVFSLALGNISLQYERGFTPHLSGLVGVRVGPERSLPFSGLFKGFYDTDTLARNLIGGTRFSNYAITPEIRYYLGKKHLSGFYVGVFGRFGKYSLDVPFTIYDASFKNGQQEVLLQGSYGYGGGGLQLGAKFNVSPRVSIDWFFLGPMVSYGQVKLDAQTDLSGVSADSRTETYRELINTFTDVSVDDNGVRVSTNLGAPGIRTGLAVGFRF